MPATSNQSDRTGRPRWPWVLVGCLVAVVGVGIALTVDGGDDQDPLAVFCEDAVANADELAGDDQDRQAALQRLEASAPDDLADLVEDAAAPVNQSTPDDLFVVPGDANSAVNVDVAAEMWAERTTERQARMRVEQVLVSECGLRLDDVEGEG